MQDGLGEKFFIATLAALGEIWVPDSVRAELANVMWQWCRNGGVPVEVAAAALELLGARERACVEQP